jgi:hypothetical protein
LIAEGWAAARRRPRVGFSDDFGSGWRPTRLVFSKRDGSRAVPIAEAMWHWRANPIQHETSTLFEGLTEMGVVDVAAAIANATRPVCARPADHAR